MDVFYCINDMWTDDKDRWIHFIKGFPVINAIFMILPSRTKWKKTKPRNKCEKLNYLITFVSIRKKNRDVDFECFRPNIFRISVLAI